MRYIKLFTALMVICFCQQSCQKNKEKDPSFSATTSKTTYKVGDTIQFSFTGNPNMLTFFSGEPGKRFEYVKRAKAEGTPILQFTSLIANGAQPNSLAVMISDNFAGSGANEAATAANIAAANWTDVTNRVTLSTGTTTASGAVNLSDVAADKPIYVAFRYRGEAGSIQRKWTITGFSVVNNLPDGTTYTLANLTNTAINNYGVSTTTSPGWAQAKVANSFGWTITAGSQLVITGATTAAAATSASEAWVYTGKIDLRRVSPDLGVAIKNITTRIFSYNYIYTKAGTYMATFQGINNTVYDQRETTRKIQLTITP